MAEQPQAFADARVLSIFPTCVWLHDLKPEDYQPINAAIVPKIEALIEPRAETIKAGIWQTNHDLHRLDEFRRLVAVIRRPPRARSTSCRSTTARFRSPAAGPTSTRRAPGTARIRTRTTS